MTNDVAAFDPAALKKRVAESVQSQFGMLIPAEQFDQMVADEVKAYFETEISTLVREEDVESSWNSRKVYRWRSTMTPFRRQCWEKVAALTEQAIKNHLDSDAFKAQINEVWDDKGQKNNVEADLSLLLQQKLEALAPKMASRMFQQVFVEAVSQAKMEMQHELQKRLGS